MSVSTATNLEIEIDGECYALDKIPAESSAIVKDETEKLLGAIDLRTLVDDLGRVGGFIRIAYNGIGAAGPKFTAQQIEIQRLGYDITKLCDKSALTVAKFKKASSCILTDLQSTYDYLLDNLEEMALDTLSAVSKLAGDMETAALELHHDFEEEEMKVIATLEKTQQVKGDEASRIKELEQKRAEMEEEKTKELKLMQEHQDKEREAEHRRRDLEQQEDRAMSEIGNTHPLKALANAFTTATLGTKVFDTEGPERKAAAIKQARREALEAEQAIRDQRHEALSRMTSFTSKIKQCQTEENMAECAVESLHEAVGALKQLSAVMMQAALFWKQMQDHCRSLAESEMQTQVEKAMKYPEEKRLKVWTSKAFKRKAIEFYAGWVALNGVCKIYIEHIKVTQQDLYQYIAENPTYEQSRANLKELAEKFLTDLKRDQKALSDKDFEAQEKIKALGPSED